MAIGTLGVGIAASTLAFDVMDGLILRPMYYPDAARVVELKQQAFTEGLRDLQLNPTAAMVTTWRAHARLVNAVEPFSLSQMKLSEGGVAPLVIDAAAIQSSFLSFAGVRPYVGRTFDPAELRRDGPKAVMLGESLWRVRFGANPAILGRVIHLNNESYTVVGVVPHTLRLPASGGGAADAWVPLVLDDDTPPPIVLAHLSHGATLNDAERELSRLAGSALEVLPGAPGRIVASPLWALVQYRAALSELCIAVGCVLLLSCSSVAHMLLARGLERQPELTLRMAIGATRRRLLWQLTTESAALCVGGGGLGVAGALGGLWALRTFRPPALADLDTIRFNSHVLVAALLISVGVALLFGVFGTLQVSGTGRHFFGRPKVQALRSGRYQGRGMSLLVLAEVGSASTILFAAASLAGAVATIEHEDPGFVIRGLIALRFRDIGEGDAPSAAIVAGAVAALRDVPGVGEVTFASQVPPQVGSVMVGGSPQLDGGPVLTPSPLSRVAFNLVAPNYFRVLQLRFLEGSSFTDSSATGGQVVLGASVARMLWPRTSAVGHRFRLQPSQPWSVVVGVVSDVAAGGLRPDAREAVIYVPLAVHTAPVLIARVLSPALAAPALYRAVRSRTPPNVDIAALRIEDAMAETVAGPRFALTILLGFADVALVLAAVGIYGVLSYAVRQRTHDIGVRIALGAGPGDVARALLHMAGGPVVGGMGLGLIITPLIIRATSQLVGVARPASLLPVSQSVAVLALVAVAAAIWPVYRAVSIDPLTAIRSE